MSPLKVSLAGASSRRVAIFLDSRDRPRWLGDRATHWACETNASIDFSTTGEVILSLVIIACEVVHKGHLTAFGCTWLAGFLFTDCGLLGSVSVLLCHITLPGASIAEHD